LPARNANTNHLRCISSQRKTLNPQLIPCPARLGLLTPVKSCFLPNEPNFSQCLHMFLKNEPRKNHAKPCQNNPQFGLFQVQNDTSRRISSPLFSIKTHRALTRQPFNCPPYYPRQGPWNVDLRTPPGPEGSNGSLLCVCRGHPDILHLRFVVFDLGLPLKLQATR
jgi:hypothetical protein